MTAQPDGAAPALPGWQEVLDFWFAAEHMPLWFKPEPAFDAAIRERFGALIEAANAGRLTAWEAAPHACLALLIALDQLPRNAWRGTARAFSCDATARAVATRAVERGLDRQVPPARRGFFYLPFEHSEDLADQQRGCALFARLAQDADSEPDKAWTSEQLRYAVRHKEIIERFGRFPHRNALLGRPSTPAEEAFLKEPMSSF
jgi:uncharacterized protein (DUF924 family)